MLLLHDVGWPYGRRDLYYDPDTMPAEHRQPWREAGMRPGRSELLDGGGLSPTMCNAEHEGGPRNGVMTGLDDFLAEHDAPYRLVTIPIYFGLAIVVEEERLERQPELAAVLDHLESAEGRLALLRPGRGRPHQGDAPPAPGVLPAGAEPGRDQGRVARPTGPPPGTWRS